MGFQENYPTKKTYYLIIKKHRKVCLENKRIPLLEEENIPHFNIHFKLTTRVDTTDIKAIKKSIKPNTKLIHIETPGNPTIRISEIAKIAYNNNTLLSVNNPFTSPYNQRQYRKSKK